MAANLKPIFPLTPLATPVAISTANTNRDGSGTIGTVLTPGADGTRVDGVRIQATGTTTAGVVRLFVRASAGGTWFLLAEILVTAVTPSTTIQAWSYDWLTRVPLVLATGNLLGASTHNAETFNVHPMAGNY